MKRDIIKIYGLDKRYFYEHKCSLKPEDDIPKKYTCSEKLCGLFYKLILLNIDDYRGRCLFESFSECVTEIERHQKNFPCTIHPYSQLRRFVDAFFCVYVLAFAASYSIAACMPEKLPMLQLSINLELMYCVNIALNFLTGYVQGNTQRSVVLDLPKIAYHYLTTWFVVDIIPLVLHFPLIISPNLMQDVSYRAVFVLSKVARVFVSLKYASNVMESFDSKMSRKTIIETIILIYYYITWNITFQYETEYYREGNINPQSPRACSWITITKLWDAPWYLKWLFALARATSMMRFNLNMEYTEYAACSEIFMLCGWIIGKIIVCHCLCKCIITFFGTESAKAKYYVMNQQVKKFITQKKLPKNIKRNILKYYDLRFRSHFFVESRMMACVSGQLAEDILMYSGRLAVKEVGFLQQLPRSLLLEVGTKLEIVYYTAGDIIYKINTVGDCIYFIHKGTVAVYTTLGIEAYHLEDGDFFGSAALALRTRFWSTTVVAVTNCELFKLKDEVFDTIVASCPTVMQELRDVAISRIQRHFVLDERYRTQTDKHLNVEHLD